MITINKRRVSCRWQDASATRERERKKDRETERERQTDRETERQRERQREKICTKIKVTEKVCNQNFYYGFKCYQNGEDATSIFEIWKTKFVYFLQISLTRYNEHWDWELTLIMSHKEGPGGQSSCDTNT